MSFRIFIDGEAGTTGLKVAARLQAHPHVEMLHIDDAQRKDPQARLQLMQDSDMTILCLPDEAARDAVALAEGDASIRFCLLYTSPSPRDGLLSRMPSSA